MIGIDFDNKQEAIQFSNLPGDNGDFFDSNGLTFYKVSWRGFALIINKLAKDGLYCVEPDYAKLVKMTEHPILENMWIEMRPKDMKSERYSKLVLDGELIKSSFYSYCLWVQKDDWFYFVKPQQIMHSLSEVYRNLECLVKASKTPRHRKVAVVKSKSEPSTSKAFWEKVISLNAEVSESDDIIKKLLSDIEELRAENLKYKDEILVLQDKLNLEAKRVQKDCATSPGCDAILKLQEKLILQYEENKRLELSTKRAWEEAARQQARNNRDPF